MYSAAETEAEFEQTLGASSSTQITRTQRKVIRVLLLRVISVTVFSFTRSKHIKDSKGRLVTVTQISRLCVCTTVSKRSFESLMCLDLVLER